MKKCIIALLIFSLLLSFSMAVSAESPIKVFLNGEQLSFDVAPILLNDRTMVPFRKIFEAFNCKVSWDNTTQTAIGERGGKVVSLSVGNPIATVNGDSVYLDMPAVLKDSRTLVPLRFVSESLGADVLWDENTQTVTITSELSRENISYLFTPASFKERGTWSYDSPSGASLPGGALRGMTDGKPENTKDAVATFQVEKPGSYRLWVRSKDYPNDRPGIRFFSVSVNGIDSGNHYGTHGKDGFYWADGGTVTLNAGTNSVALVDSSAFYGRCDGVYLSSKLTEIPSDDYTELVNTAYLVKPDEAIVTEVAFPDYAKEDGIIKAQEELQNENTKMIFYLVSTSNGDVIQNEIYSEKDGNFVLTKNRSEGFGNLLLTADSAQSTVAIDGAHLFNTAFSLEDNLKDYFGANLYKAGTAAWLIPTKMEAQGQEMHLSGTNELVNFEIIFTLSEDAKEPKVTVKATFKADTFFTLGAFEGGELAAPEAIAVTGMQEDIEAIRPDPGILYTEDALSGERVTVTLCEENIVNQGFSIQKGIDVSETSNFGVSIRGMQSNLQAGVFSPVLGSEQSNVKAGQSYTFTYKIVSEVQ